MKSILRIIFVLIFGLLYTSCSETSSSESEFSKYTGTWLWIKTTGGFAGVEITPAEGTSLKISFDEFGRFRLYRNDSLKVIATSTVKQSKNVYDIISYSDITTFNFSFDSSNDYAYLQNDTLSLWDGMYDGFFSAFKKIR